MRYNFVFLVYQKKDIQIKFIKIVRFFWLFLL